MQTGVNEQSGLSARLSPNDGAVQRRHSQTSCVTHQSTRGQLYSRRGDIIDFVTLGLVTAVIGILLATVWIPTPLPQVTVESAATVGIAFIIAFVSYKVTINLKFGVQLAFTPYEVALYFAVATVGRWEILLVGLFVGSLGLGLRGGFSLAGFVNRANSLVIVLGAHALYSYLLPVLPWPLALLLAGTVAGVFTDILTVLGSAYRTGNWSYFTSRGMYLQLLVIHLISWLIAMPLAYVVSRSLVLAAPGVVALALVAFVAHWQHVRMNVTRSVDSFDSATHDMAMKPDEVLENLAESLCTMGAMDSAHVRLVHSSTEPREEAGPCSDCGYVPQQTNLHVVTPAGKGSWLLVDAGRERSVGESFNGGIVASIRQLATRGASRWATADLLDEAVWKASHDSMTGLVNQRGLHNDIERAAAVPQALFVVRGEGLSDVRTAAGQDAEQNIVSTIASRFADFTASTPSAQAYRLGDAVFGVLVPVTEDRSEDVIREQVQSVTSDDLLIGARLVGAFVPSEFHTTGEETVRRAFVALAAAARSAEHRIVTYSEVLEARSAERDGLRRELQLALTNGEMGIALQPQIDSSTGQVTGFEALARWNHPTFGWVNPSMFVTIAQEYGLMAQLTDQVLHQALSACRAWQSYLPGVGVSVNIAPTSLARPSLVSDFEARLHEVDLQAGLLTLELTENVLMHDPEAAAAVLQSLRDLGCTIALDDFGTGYSALSSLSEVPVDEVKVDRSFMRAAHSSEQGVQVLRHVVSLLQSLNLSVVAEGVESFPMVELLSEMGCTVIQGYVYAQPMAPADIESWVRTRRSVHVVCDPEPAILPGAPSSRRPSNVASLNRPRLLDASPRATDRGVSGT